MAQFRKQPVVIEARQLQSEQDADGLALWIYQSGGNAMPKLLGNGHGGYDFDGLLIATREGSMKADLGDWIIRGVMGEFYPCKPDIFAATYEPAEAPHAAPTPPPDGERGETLKLVDVEMEAALKQFDTVETWLVEHEPRSGLLAVGSRSSYLHVLLHLRARLRALSRPSPAVEAQS